MLDVFYGSCAYYYISEYRLFPFVAARQLMEFQFSESDESGILCGVGQIKHIVSLMQNLPIGVVVFLV